MRPRDALIALLTAAPVGNPRRACGDALNWLRTLPTSTTPEQAWRACERPDWLFWFCWWCGVDRHWIVAAACACVRGVWDLLPDARRRSLETTERWSRGLASDAEVRATANAAAAADAAYAATYAAYAAACAADDAADATYATYAAYAAACAADDADAAAYAADAARANATRSCCRRIRCVIPWRLLAPRLGARPR